MLKKRRKHVFNAFMAESLTTCSNGDTCALNSEVEYLRQEVKQLAELVSTDNLTGLFNHRFFTSAIAQEIERSQRTGQPTTLIMLDADHFKKVNDQWGHEVGNQALKLIANCLTNNIRKLDIACRYGGEEFAIILPSTDLPISAQVAERIRSAVENTPLIINSSKHPLNLTISLGLSSYTPNNRNHWSQLVEQADAELYRAKQEGRNQVCYPATGTTEQQVNQDEKQALFDMFRHQ